MKIIYQPIMDAIFDASGYTLQDLKDKSCRQPLAADTAQNV